MVNPSKIANEIDTNRRVVAFDSYDIAVRQVADMVMEKTIEIAPAYQRHFVWDEVRQSQLIESLFLGIPIPSLFMATNRDSTWEVVDGLQRITSILNFVSDETHGPDASKHYKKLRLTGLEKIASMNGLVFEELPKQIQTMFWTRPIKVTVLNDRSDFGVRYDLFERLNTGGIVLHPQEIRQCIFIGRFSDFIKECAEYPHFRQVVKVSREKAKTGNLEELVLKFFAYLEQRDEFVHEVKEFLNDFMKDAHAKFDHKTEQRRTAIFEKTFDFLARHLKDGIVRGERLNTTPLVLYEAVAVGTADAILSGEKINAKKLIKVLDDEELKSLTTGGTNSRKMLRERIDFVKRYITE